MYLRLVFIHLWLILSERVGLRSHVFGCRACGRVSVAGCERLAMGPGWGQRCRFCWSGGVDGVGGSGWGDDVGDRVGAVRWGCVVGTLGRRRHLGGRADVVVSQGEGTGAS